MFDRLGSFVARRWTLVLGVWIVAIAAIHAVAPRWNDVTKDGDFAYLPEDRTSVKGNWLLAREFPDYYSKSQVALVLARKNGPLTVEDYKIGKELIERFPPNEASETGSATANASTVGESSPISAVWHYNVTSNKPSPLEKRFEAKGPDGKIQAVMIVLYLENEFMAVENMEFIRSLYDTLDEIRARPDFPKGLQLGVTGSAAIGADMLFAAEESIRNTELTTILLVILILLLVYRAPGLVLVPLVTIGVSVILSMDLVALAASWADHNQIDFKVFKTTRIFIVVILFGAGTDYCLFLIARYKEELQRGLGAKDAIGEAIGCVGNALAASALTTVLGLGMLFFADFGKFSSSGPTIGLCLLVTLLAAVTLTPAVLCAVGPIVFWPFVPKKKEEKGGMSAKGSDTFCRNGPEGVSQKRCLAPLLTEPEGITGRFWDRLSRLVTKHPGVVLIVAILLMCPFIHPVRRGVAKIFGQDPAGLQVDVSDATPPPRVTGDSPEQEEVPSWTVPVSYNLLQELPRRCPSIQGMQLLKRYFSSNETNPITIVAFEKGGDFSSPEGRDKIALLTVELFDFVYTDRHGRKVTPVVSVRSLAEPLGYNPHLSSPFNPKTYAKHAARGHSKTYPWFVSITSPISGQLTRLDVVTKYPPFSIDNLRLLDQIEEALQKKTKDQNSGWHNATFHYAGNTAGIRDLKEVTTHDNLRIQILVVIAVLVVLLIILRRPWVCLYLIVSVLFGYYVTIGATELIFRWVEGPSFTGLDWKVPIFLFVILVAIGEDYNIYLTTRVFEEQRRFGPLEGLRIAMLRTGGIITSCGVIMAGTFISMATGTLSMMQQLGFALALGVLLDTFVIRTILVPAFFALGIKSVPDKL